MWHKQKQYCIKLNDNEKAAILCALDLVVNSDSGNEDQNALNFYNCNIVAQKLHTGIASFIPNELRVISVGIGFAIDLLALGGNPYISMDELDDDWKADLKRFEPIYNRLLPQIDALTAQFIAETP